MNAEDIARATAALAGPPASPIDVVFAIPSLGGTPSFETTIAMMKVAGELAKHKINHAVIARLGDAYLAKVRSKLASDFLNQFPGVENFFFIDDDVGGFPPEKVVEFIRRPESLLLGIYPKKQDITDFPVILLSNTETGELIERDGLVAAAWGPTGFMRIKRHVLEAVAAKSKRFRDMEPDGKEAWYWLMFDCGLGKDDWYWGEDFNFCRCWREECSGEIWVDPNIPFTHRGTKKWENNLASNLDVYRMRAKETFLAKGSEMT
jgi:hypothetical protein